MYVCVHVPVLLSVCMCGACAFFRRLRLVQFLPPAHTASILGWVSVVAWTWGCSTPWTVAWLTHTAKHTSINININIHVHASIHININIHMHAYARLKSKAHVRSPTRWRHVSRSTAAMDIYKHIVISSCGWKAVNMPPGTHGRSPSYSKNIRSLWLGIGVQPTLECIALGMSHRAG